MSGVVIDDELARLIPPLSREERGALEAEILADGRAHTPIVVWDEEGTIVDGHNRYGICSAHGLPFQIERRSFADRNAAKRWMRRNQLGRRNLTPEAASYLRGQEYNEGKGPVGRPELGNSCTITKNRLAVEFSVSPRTIVNDAKFSASIDALSEEFGDEVRDKVLSRDARVTRKDAMALAEVCDAEERRTLALSVLNSPVRKSLSDARREMSLRDAATEPVDVTGQQYVTVGDMRDVCASMDPGSIDAIVSDPPYPKEHLHLYEDLAIQAARLLRHGGSCVAMAGQSYLPDIMAMMSRHLRYHWTLAYLTPGGQAVQLWQRNVNTFWKPLLWFTNGDYDGSWVGDVSRSKTNDNDKRFHEWGQSESGMLDIVERMTKPGELVLDPFCGAGTTGVACLLLGRRFLGIESDPDKAHLAQQRLSAERIHTSVMAHRAGQSGLFGSVEE